MDTYHNAQKIKTFLSGCVGACPLNITSGETRFNGYLTRKTSCIEKSAQNINQRQIDKETRRVLDNCVSWFENVVELYQNTNKTLIHLHHKNIMIPLFQS